MRGKYWEVKNFKNNSRYKRQSIKREVNKTNEHPTKQR